MLATVLGRCGLSLRFAAQISVFHWLHQMSKYCLRALILFNITDRRAAGKYKYVICVYFCVTLNQRAQLPKIFGHLFKMLIVSPPLSLSLSLSLFALVYMLSVPQATCAVYTGCSSRIMACFRRVCSGLIYIDVTKRTYVQNWPVMMILTREKYGLLEVTGTAHL